MRTVIVLVCLLLSGATLADSVRLLSVPERYWETWALSTDLCRDDKSVFVVSAKGYVTSQENCTIQWLTETAGAEGPNRSEPRHRAERPRGAFGRPGFQATQSLSTLSIELAFSARLGVFMAQASRGSSVGVAPRAIVGAILISLVSASAATAEPASIEELVSAMVRINAHINPDGRTVQGLGHEREGSGILIDGDGLVLTIGYLMVEAYAAEIVANNGRTVPANVVGYDQESGFGLLRTITPLKLKPMPLGKSAEIKQGDPVLVASFGGPGMVAGAYVVAKREFAGNWEYLLDEALFTAPPHPAWSGAALISREGKLVGVGSLLVGNAGGGNNKAPGNMFVPIDRLSSILADLIAAGRTPGPARPWLGVNTDEMGGRLLVSRITRRARRRGRASSAAT